METSLHQQLKDVYADIAEGDAQVEVPLGNYRIDVMAQDELIEIQHGALAAIRDKIRDLTDRHRVLVVKPIIATKRLIKQDEKGGSVVGRRLSPKRGRVLDVFDELVYFTRAFPHKNLRLEVPLVHIEEWRFPGHGRRRRWRRKDHQVEDQKLVSIDETYHFRTTGDLLKLLPLNELPSPFHTGHLAEAMEENRSTAQRIVYCLREMGALMTQGKQGNAILYKVARKRRKPRKPRKRGAPSKAG